MLLRETVLYVSFRIRANTTHVLIRVIPGMKNVHMRVTTRRAITYMRATVDVLFRTFPMPTRATPGPVLYMGQLGHELGHFGTFWDNFLN